MPQAGAKRRGITVQRILVPLDASRESYAALKSAVELAARLDAEIEGLFVEDDNLLRAAGLACSRLVHFTTARASDFDHADMERELRLSARSIRAALAAEASRLELQWSFRIDRGDVAARILAAAPEADLVIVGRTSRRLRARPRLGSTAQRLVNSVPAVLVAGEAPRAHFAEHVVCAFDASAVSRRALDLAVAISKRDGGHLLVLLCSDEAQPEAVEAATAAAGPPVELAVEYRRMPDLDFQSLKSALHHQPAALLVLPVGLEVIDGMSVDAIVAALDVSVLLVRG